MHNQDIFEKARELGALLRDSDQFVAMRKAEESANGNDTLLSLSQEYESLRSQMQALTIEDEPDYDKIGEVSKAMDEVQAKLNGEPAMKALRVTSEQFSMLMNLVNRELQGVLAPETLQQSACGGSCASCAGCN
jgi:cell fate (sporulation/competence/biofilm development) regulator YlbF (YheA/YmcA/DUF963 family)